MTPNLAISFSILKPPKKNSLLHFACPFSFSISFLYLRKQNFTLLFTINASGVCVYTYIFWKHASTGVVNAHKSKQASQHQQTQKPKRERQLLHYAIIILIANMFSSLFCFCIRSDVCFIWLNLLLFIRLIYSTSLVYNTILRVLEQTCSKFRIESCICICM